MELRVGGEGFLGLGMEELAGTGKGGCRKRGEYRRAGRRWLPACHEVADAAAGRGGGGRASSGT
jgi:hypothetical protein